MNLDLTGLAEVMQSATGEPLMLPLEVISCDPSQPRKHFDETALMELAESIRAIGVVQPISVHQDPAAPGRYIINYGERRYRASLLAGMRSIPVFVHKTPDDYRQVAENLHRADLSPMEMALFIKRRLDAGEKRNEIAAQLGYKKSYVTEHLALLEAPACVEKAYANGATSPRTLYDLRRLHDEFPQEVEAWCASGIEVTRDTVEALVRTVRRDEFFPLELIHDVRRDELSDAPLSTDASTAITAHDAQLQSDRPGPEDSGQNEIDTEPHGRRTGRIARQSRTNGSRPQLLIKVMHDGRKATVEDESTVLIRYDDGGTAEVLLSKTMVLGTAAV
ncbi:ParB/RepB/Spo0J family partition protein [Herbaspirillum sp. SJZ107]|uniref:ParB/RepB/Spo0J family partition protein n=1 Tax=Herbaspirillum sp. SJZ107 TaxID=2572881 RepID=UPI0011503938|nr:ParB/RepB/Spo0J family partition protein [Herbaspirillum sp. SJZ107]TQK03401.1 ParB family chromosome partitioning protein [Herbaspirillum sp. SJZ107]